jgi:2-(1,2-epoxy-1,2-dihydrophenyl)acetyl-CoA isomerase
MQAIKIDWPDPAVMVVTLDRPEKLNAISREVRDALIAEMRQIEREAGRCRAVVITGTGRAFSAGGDVSQFGEMFAHGSQHAADNMLLFQEMCRLLIRLPVPVITAINGMARGGGTAVALMSDLRIAASDAVFSVGQVRRGLVPDVGLTYLLPRVVGLARALELMLMDTTIDAQRALDIGLINRVVPPDQLMPAALQMARSIASLPSPAVRWVKRVTYMNLDSGFEQALNLEAMAESMLVDTPEFKESLSAFVDKRR